MRAFARRGYGLTVLLVLLCLGLGLLVAAEWWHASRAGAEHLARLSAPVEPTVRLAELPTGDFTLHPLGRYTELVERPLFLASRRPPEEEAEEEAGEEQVSVAEAVERPDVTLTGVIISPQVRTALLRDNTTGRVAHLAEGTELQGWRVEQVQPDKVVLGREGETFEVTLRPPAEAAAADEPEAAPAPRRPRQLLSERLRQLQRQRLERQGAR